MADKFPIYALCMWHNAPYMMDKKCLIAADYTPVLFEGGEGVFYCMGYLAQVTDTHASVIIDNSFTITTGNPPMDDQHILSDMIKSSVSNVVAKTLAIARMEIKMSGNKSEIDLIIDDVGLNKSIPEQLMEISKWEVKYLVLDHNGVITDKTYTPDRYFSQRSPDVSFLTELSGRWDQFFTLSDIILNDMDNLANNHVIDSTNHEIIHDMMDEMEAMEDRIHAIRYLIFTKLHSQQEIKED